MSDALKQALAVQAIRLAASTQALAVAALHAGWMLLALATWPHAAANGSAVDTIASGLVRGYAWLGGVDAGGHGDLDNLWAVWGKVSLVVYAFDALLRRVRGVRPPAHAWQVAMVSGSVALLGYALALWPQRLLQDTPADAAFVIVLVAVLAALAAAWALLVRRAGERLIRALAARSGERLPDVA